nr:PREDICTED: uncharacterized protein LOC103376033 [Stegastes partitus]
MESCPGYLTKPWTGSSMCRTQLPGLFPTPDPGSTSSPPSPTFTGSQSNSTSRLLTIPHTCLRFFEDRVFGVAVFSHVYGEKTLLKTHQFIKAFEQYHLNNSAYGPFGQGLPHPHSNHSTVGLNKYTSLKAVADSASRSYYKSFPLMDFSHYQPVAPPAFQPIHPKEKSYIHQPLPAHHDIHAPLAISIPSSHLEHSRLPKTTTHPFLSSSAFKAWEPTGRHVHRQTSAPGHTSSSVHSSARRHAYSARRQQSIENMPDLFNQPYGGMYGGAGQGQHMQGQHVPQPYYHHTRQKSYSTHSTTEVTV